MTDPSSSQTTWNDWIDGDVVDQTGTKIGTVANIYMDRASGAPEWLAVQTGLFGTKETFVPLEGVTSSGDALQVPYEKSFVKDAPNVDPEDGYLEPAEEQRLYEYYGRSGYQSWDDSSDVDVSAGRDISEPETDSAMTRSEEELEVGTREREAGRVRLRKYVETENVTTTVPLRKERIRVEREPITEANIGDAKSGADISEEEHEVVLTEEEAVVGKRTVPKERVRAKKDVTTEERTVSEDVRKEKIEVEDPSDGGDV